MSQKPAKKAGLAPCHMPLSCPAHQSWVKDCSHHPKAVRPGLGCAKRAGAGLLYFSHNEQAPWFNLNGRPSQVTISGPHIALPFRLSHHLSDDITRISFHVCLHHQTTFSETKNRVLFICFLNPQFPKMYLVQRRCSVNLRCINKQIQYQSWTRWLENTSKHEIICFDDS